MKINVRELANNIKESNLDKLEYVNSNLVRLIIEEAFTYIKKDINNTDEGVVQVVQLGKFRIMKIDKENETKKRIIFRPNELI